MENRQEDEDSEEVDDEFFGEGVEEEEQRQPPGYRCAEGPYKPFCNCQDNVTCSFCSWFYLVKECPAHGTIAQRPPKPCWCPRTTTQLENGSTTGLKKYESHLIDNCDCIKTPPIETCSCQNDIISSSTTSSSHYLSQRENEGSFEGFHGENGIASGGGVDEDDYDGNFPKTTYNGSYGVQVQSIKQGSNSTKARRCTCDEAPTPRSGSSTELESSISGSSDTESSSQYDLTLFPNLQGSSSDIVSSENSSDDGTDIDWTEVRWFHNTSDRSVESVSDDDYDESVKRRVAVKKLSRLRRRHHKAKTSENPTRYQYLVVQQSLKRSFRDICKGDKDLPRPYFYDLMRII